MIPFKCDIDISKFQKFTETMLKQLPFATAKALTSTAKDAETSIRDSMRGNFDRPTPYTLNSLYTKPATKDSLQAFVWIKSDAAKGTPAVRYLFPEVAGGDRQHKRGENALIRMGIMNSDQWMIPGERVLDSYGNISAGMMTKILSGLGANPDSFQNVTTKSRRRAIEKGKNLDLFVGRPGGGRLPFGVYERRSNGVRLLLLIIDKKPKYRTRLPFYDIAQKVYSRRFQKWFDAAMAEAIATARR